MTWKCHSSAENVENDGQLSIQLSFIAVIFVNRAVKCFDHLELHNQHLHLQKFGYEKVRKGTKKGTKWRDNQQLSRSSVSSWTWASLLNHVLLPSTERQLPKTLGKNWRLSRTIQAKSQSQGIGSVQSGNENDKKWQKMANKLGIFFGDFVEFLKNLFLEFFWNILKCLGNDKNEKKRQKILGYFFGFLLIFFFGICGYFWNYCWILFEIFLRFCCSSYCCGRWFQRRIRPAFARKRLRRTSWSECGPGRWWRRRNYLSKWIQIPFLWISISISREFFLEHF